MTSNEIADLGQQKGLAMPDLLSYLSCALTTGDPVMVLGDPGIGKTEGVRWWAKSIGRRLIEMHPAVYRDGEIMFPVVIENPDGTKTPRYVPTNELADVLSCDDEVVCFVDDTHHADFDTVKVLMQLVRGRVGEFPVPDNVFIVLAANDTDDSAGNRGMMEPFKSSMIIVRLTVDHGAFLEHAAANGCHDDVLGFLAMNPQFIHDFKPTTKMTKTPCPRENMRFSRQLEALDSARTSGAMAEETAIRAEYEAARGCCGETYARTFCAQRQQVRKLSNAGLCLAAPETCELPDAYSEQSALYMTLTAIGRAAADDESKRKAAYIIAERVPELFRRVLVDTMRRINPAVEQDAYVHQSEVLSTEAINVQDLGKLGGI